MNLFHLNARMHSREGPATKTWLVVARNLPEAVSLVPDGHVLVSVEVHAPCRPGPARVLGWMGPPPSLKAAASRQPPLS